jgi:hypothetical protein
LITILSISSADIDDWNTNFLVHSDPPFEEGPGPAGRPAGEPREALPPDERTRNTGHPAHTRRQAGPIISGPATGGGIRGEPPAPPDGPALGGRGAEALQEGLGLHGVEGGARAAGVRPEPQPEVLRQLRAPRAQRLQLGDPARVPVRPQRSRLAAGGHHQGVAFYNTLKRRCNPGSLVTLPCKNFPLAAIWPRCCLVLVKSCDEPLQELGVGRPKHLPKRRVGRGGDV